MNIRQFSSAWAHKYYTPVINRYTNLLQIDFKSKCAATVSATATQLAPVTWNTF